jgi:hypothetical protein
MLVLVGTQGIYRSNNKFKACTTAVGGLDRVTPVSSLVAC